MRYGFGEFEVDTDAGELRHRGAPRPVQPLVFSLLVHLLERRDRFVPKDELIESLWQDAIQGDGALQRAVSLTRKALREMPDAIRTLPRRGYRFAGPVVAHTGAATVPPIRYALSGTTHIAWTSLGAGPLDIVIVPGWTFPMSAAFELPETRRELDGLARFGRVVLFDKRGTGLSDREGIADLPTRADDLAAVLQACGSRSAILVGVSEGGPMCLLYAATRPGSVRGLVLAGAFARMTAGDGAPGWTGDQLRELEGYVRSSWGAGGTISAAAPSQRANPVFRYWACRAERTGCSPGAALDVLRMNLAIDARELLPRVKARTIVVHRTGDLVVPFACGELLARGIAGARLVEVPGTDHMFCFDSPDRLVAAVGELASTKE